MLQRIYGTAWANKKQLKPIPDPIEEAEKRDHRRIGKKLDLFHLQEEAPGMVFWHPAGWSIYQTIEQYMRKAQQAKTRLPRDQDAAVGRHVAVAALWGHAWDKYGDDMFMLRDRGPRVCGQAMNCPATCRCSTRVSSPTGTCPAPG